MHDCHAGIINGISNGTMFILTFMKIHALVQNLLMGPNTHQHDNVSKYFLTK